MQSAAGLIERVRGIAGDRCFVPRVFENLNDGLAHVSRLVRPPDLQVSSAFTVSASENFSLLPANFFGPRIFSARNVTTSTEITKIFYRNLEFLRLYPAAISGPVEALLIRGSKAYVSGIPVVDEEIEIKYLSKPVYFEDMEDDGSAITYLPDRLGEKAIVMYAVMEEFRIIEDGVDGVKRNMQDAEKSMMEIIAEIAAYYGTENYEDGGPVVAYDTLGLFSSRVTCGVEQL